MKKETKKATPVEKGKVIDFRSIEIKDLTGEIKKFDISKGFGNYLYTSTGDIGMFEVARKIYHEGKIELKEHQEKELIGILNDPKCPFIAVLKVKLIEMIKGE